MEANFKQPCYSWSNHYQSRDTVQASLDGVQNMSGVTVEQEPHDPAVN